MCTPLHTFTICTINFNIITVYVPIYVKFAIDNTTTVVINYKELYDSVLIKIQPDATVCRYLFTAKSLYTFRVSQHPSSGVLKTVTAASGTGHNIGTATSLQRAS